MPPLVPLTPDTVAAAQLDWSDKLVDAARAAGEDVDVAVALAFEYGTRLPQPGAGQTAARWAVLADVAAVNVTVARVLEAHSDALAILREAGEPEAALDGSWGVFAAEAADARLAADGAGEHVTLSGRKPWCSLGDRLDNALVTAHVDGEQRRLFRVALRRPDVRADAPHTWVARGLRTVTSVGLTFDDTPARAVGAPGWYLDRPGFAWGGIGVAACWYGAALGVGGAVTAAAARRPGDLPDMHAGAVDAALHAAGCTLAQAAQQVDAGAAAGADGELLALRVRAVVADAAEAVLRHAAHALGPAPLAFDAAHAARVADLELYVRQHHAERDLAALGHRVAGRATR